MTKNEKNTVEVRVPRKRDGFKDHKTTVRKKVLPEAKHAPSAGTGRPIEAGPEALGLSREVEPARLNMSLMHPRAAASLNALILRYREGTLSHTAEAVLDRLGLGWREEAAHRDIEASHQEIAELDTEGLSWLEADQFGPDGFDGYGLDREGFDRNRLDWAGFDQDDFGPDGFNSYGHDRGGFDRDGWSEASKVHPDTGTVFAPDGWNKGSKKHRDTGSPYGPDGRTRAGFDTNGFMPDGFNRKDLDRQGFHRSGWDRGRGIHRDTGTRLGPDGFDRTGHDKDGVARSKAIS